MIARSVGPGLTSSTVGSFTCECIEAQVYFEYSGYRISKAEISGRSSYSNLLGLSSLELQVLKRHRNEA